MATAREILDDGRRRHASGDIVSAAQCYEIVLRAEPANYEALALYGSACQALGRLDDAEAHFLASLRIRPDLAQVHNSLGVVLVRKGQREAALNCFEQAVLLDPGYAPAQNNRGSALQESGRVLEAESAYRAAVSAEPEYSEAWCNLGSVLRQQKRHEEAMACLQTAIRLRPQNAEPHAILGSVYADLNRHDDAIASFARALASDPARPIVQNNLGVSLAELRQFDAAIGPLQEAIRLAPAYAVAYRNLANVLRALSRLKDALAACQRSIAITPDDPESHNALGVIWFEMARYEESRASYEKALNFSPQSTKIRRNRALLRMLDGDFQGGYGAFEEPWSDGDGTEWRFSQPQWDGASLRGRTILLFPDQGLGDTLQFVRYAPLVKEKGGSVILACQRPLLGLLEGFPGVDRLIATSEIHGPTVAFDVQAPLTGLLRILGTTLDTIPPCPQELRPPPEGETMVRGILNGLHGVRVGIAWQGNPKHRRDCIRSFRLSEFAPIAEIPGITLVSLQKGVGAEQTQEMLPNWPLVDLGNHDDESPEAFLSTAAAIRQLDLVIVADSAMAHLAASLGTPTWIALPYVPDWRWLIDRDDSPWYPAVRLFRQSRWGDWPGVFARIAAALRAELERQSEFRSERLFGER